MVQHVDAVYENGVLRPLQPLSLANSERVRVTVVTDHPSRTQRDMKLLANVQTEVASMKEIPSLEEVQQMLSAIPGALTQDFVAEREDR